MGFKEDLLKMQKTLSDFEQRYLEGVMVGLLEEGYALDAEMVPLIPVRTGRTKSSHFVKMPIVKTSPQVVVGVGTSYAPYLRLKGMAKPAINKINRRKTSSRNSDKKIKVKDDNFLKVAFERRQQGYGSRLGKRVVAAVKNKKQIGQIRKSAPNNPKE